MPRMRLALGHVDELDESVLAFGRQLGLESIQLHCPRELGGSEDPWRYDDIAALAETCRRSGLVLEGIENVPHQQWLDIVIGGPDRNRQLHDYCRTIEHLGLLGIPVLGHNFMPDYVWRTSMAERGRGGALVSSFDLEQVASGNALASYALTPQPRDVWLEAEDLWDNYRQFLEAVLPIAEGAGVRIALHPDDPPLTRINGGNPRIMTGLEDLERARLLAGGSKAWGVNLCLGTISEMGGSDTVHRAIDTFGRDGDIASVHLRDVMGTSTQFDECFLGEGNFDPLAVLRHLQKVEFDGFLIDDHVPAMIFDVDTWVDTSPEAYCSRGRAYTIGLIQGLMVGLGI